MAYGTWRVVAIVGCSFGLGCARAEPSTGDADAGIDPTSSAGPASRATSTSLARAAVTIAPRDGTAGALRRLVPPATVDAPLRIARASKDDDEWLEVTPLDVRPAAAEHVSPGVLRYRDAAPDADVVHAREPGRFEELRVLRTPLARGAARYRVTTGAAIAELRPRAGHLDAIGRDGAVVASMERPSATDARGVTRDASVRLEPVGAHAFTLTVTLDVDGLAFPVTLDPAWSTVAPMSVARRTPCAARLADGRVLVHGGLNSTGTLSTTEIYQPSTNVWTTVAASPSARNQCDAVTLSDGRVFVMTQGTEAAIYDPATDAWTPTASAPIARGNVPLVVTGTMVVTGGAGQLLGWDATTAAWVSDASLTIADGRGTYALARLPSGEILLAGGIAAGAFPGTTFAIDPHATPWKWTARAALPSGKGRQQPAVTRLGGGAIMLVGGNGAGGAALYDYLGYDEGADAWTLAGTLTGIAPNRQNVPVATLDTTGFVGSNNPLGAMLFLPDGRLALAKIGNPTFGAAAAIDGKRVVLAGGQTSGIASARVDVYEPQAPGATCGSDGECLSGYCTDGVCCGTACGDVCERCDATGACVPNVGPVRSDPRRAGACGVTTGGGACDEQCDGVDRSACHLAKAGAACSAAACAAGVETHAGTCDGAGVCDHAQNDCAPYGCDAAGAHCLTTCTTSAECASGKVCNGGACVAPAAAGATCTAVDNCTSGFCVDGVCCDKACDGQCVACDLAGLRGTCSAVSGEAPHGARAACPGVARCDGDAFVGAEVCAAGACAAPTTRSCAPYGCSSAGCRVACALDTDCATGFVCRANACVSPPSATCSDDRTTSRDAAGAVTPCTPYLCGSGGSCLRSCMGTDDCASGLVCDSTDHTCAAPPPTASGGSDGGCAVRSPAPEAARSGLAAVALLGLLARRSGRRRRDARHG